MRFKKGFVNEVREWLARLNVSPETIKEKNLVNETLSQIRNEFMERLTADGMEVTVVLCDNGVRIGTSFSVNKWFMLNHEEQKAYDSYLAVNTKEGRRAAIMSKPYYTIGNYLLPDRDSYFKLLGAIITARREGRRHTADGLNLLSKVSSYLPYEKSIEVQDYLEGLGFSIEIDGWVYEDAEYSDNKNHKFLRAKFCVGIIRDGVRVRTTDYWPSAMLYYKDGRKGQFDEFLKERKEPEGKYLVGFHKTLSLYVQCPQLADVFYSFMMDRPQGEQFEDWCSLLGYDEDSRKAYKIYEACCKEEADLNKWLTEEQISKLEELLEDY